MIWLWLVLGAVAVQRVAELVRARRNAAWLRAHGARFVAHDGFAAIVSVHVLFFVLPVAEAAAWGTRPGWWSIAGAAMVVVGESLRHHAMRHLGRRWNTRVFVLPGAPLVASGLYGRIRHPNYAGVALTLAGLPIIFGLWRTTLALAVLNGAALAYRIRVEERELAAAAHQPP